ncbi:hypothetical protein GCM10010206_66800 [Streptomyces cinerochromogenes]|nr:hypothetical protein GCM10010206_66800 [Streptomyces cinerochromogenes]
MCSWHHVTFRAITSSRNLVTGAGLGKPLRERSPGPELEGAAQGIAHRRADDGTGGPLHPLHGR